MEYVKTKGRGVIKSSIARKPEHGGNLKLLHLKKITTEIWTKHSND